MQAREQSAAKPSSLSPLSSGRKPVFDGSWDRFPPPPMNSEVLQSGRRLRFYYLKWNCHWQMCPTSLLARLFKLFVILQMPSCVEVRWMTPNYTKHIRPWKILWENNEKVWLLDDIAQNYVTVCTVAREVITDSETDNQSSSLPTPSLCSLLERKMRVKLKCCLFMC